MTINKLQLGAIYHGDNRCSFEVWAPLARKVELKIVSPNECLVEMEPDDWGYYRLTLNDIEPGTKYLYRLDEDKERPDPCSRFQPEGVHGPSAVVDPAFEWTDSAWKPMLMQDYIIYELHVGTYTHEGTFDAIIPKLAELKELGINAIEIMPVSQFPGGRNWGYDGVYPFATQNTYGGLDGFRRLVNACHAQGIAVILDVVYNHLGPEGNYLWDYGHYFTSKYKTPWGEALNFDDAHSDEVRRFFLENALFWMEVAHIDALRLDAVHAILDFSAYPFLQELSEMLEENALRLGRNMHLIAESDLNDVKEITPREEQGWGHDSQWTDDFHHSLHALLTGERDGYYSAFGRIDDLAKAFQDSFVYSGQYSPYRKHRFGNDASHRPPGQFVIYAQNHDQVGNRMHGDRISNTISFEAQKLMACAYLLSPFVAMLFMGEEYGETNPFPYFISHTDENLVKSVQKGRKREFKAFSWKGTPPDPAAAETFTSAYLDRDKKTRGNHAFLYNLYRHLIALRKEHPVLKHLTKEGMKVSYHEENRWITLFRTYEKTSLFLILSFNVDSKTTSITTPSGGWNKILDTASEKWGGSGSAIMDTIETGGKIEMNLPAHAAILFEQKL